MEVVTEESTGQESAGQERERGEDECDDTDIDGKFKEPNPSSDPGDCGALKRTSFDTSRAAAFAGAIDGERVEQFDAAAEVEFDAATI